MAVITKEKTVRKEVAVMKEKVVTKEAVIMEKEVAMKAECMEDTMVEADHAWMKILCRGLCRHAVTRYTTEAEGAAARKESCPFSLRRSR